jgi:hypothetical protein
VARKESGVVSLGRIVPIKSIEEYEEALVVLMGGGTVSDNDDILREKIRVEMYTYTPNSKEEGNV